MTMERPEGNGPHDALDDGRIVVGIVASPGPATELAVTLEAELVEQLVNYLPDVRWSIEIVSTRLVAPPADLSDLVVAARRLVLDHGWQLALCITDLPLQTARRPVVAHASATHGVAVLSLPALGPLAVRRRATATLVRLVGALLDDDETNEDDALVRRRTRELGSRVERDERGLRFAARVLSGNLRLLFGMLHANRPWRLASKLSRALVAALALGVFSLVTSDIWRLSNSLGTLRLGLLAAGSVLGTALTLLLGAGLWERAPTSSAREQVVLFNIVTLATLVVGVLVLYAALFVLMAVGAFGLPRSLLASTLGHGVGAGDRLQLAWLAASIATVGGALGAALESDSAVREAAYTYHADAPPLDE